MAGRSRGGPAAAACLAGLLLAAGVGVGLSGHGARPGGGVGGPFRLVAPDGTVVTDRRFRGRYELIYFGYTSCADICPATLNNIAGAMSRLGGRAAEVQPLFITLDPARDTRQVLARYTAAFTPSLIGLTGEAADLRDVAARFHVYSQDAGHGRLDHGSVLYLMDRNGVFLAPIRADASAAEMAAQIGRLMS